MIYLDHAATTPIDQRVLNAMMPYMISEFGNPGSLHELGRSALKAVHYARDQVARFFNCSPEQVIFTSGGTEGNNFIISGLENELRRRGRTSVAVSAIEHDSVLKAAKKLCMKDDFHLQICPPDADGQVYISSIYEHTDSNTGLLSVMTANNETGVINDVGMIGEFCSNNGIIFHTDAVQAAGLVFLNTADEYTFGRADFITVSSHKINGPKGMGAVFVRNPELLSPMICGGSEQEFGLRGGTENVPGMIGLGMACEIARLEYDNHLKYLESQYSQLVFQLKMLAQNNSIEMRINGDTSNSVPKTLNVCFPGVDAQTLLLMLDSKRIYLSAGSACTAHENTPSHVLTAMGISEEDARSSVRISLSHLIPEDDIMNAAIEIIDCVKTMRSV